MAPVLLLSVLLLGGLAQLARAPALQAGGQRFESVILHSVTTLPGVSDKKKEHIDILEARNNEQKTQNCKTQE